jgi:hypothetical protein
MWRRFGGRGWGEGGERLLRARVLRRMIWLSDLSHARKVFSIYVGTPSAGWSGGGTASRNFHLIEIGASPSQETKSTSPQ